MGKLTAWPEADASKAVENTVEVVFQVNGKLRAKANVDKSLDKAALEALAMENDRVQGLPLSRVLRPRLRGHCRGDWASARRAQFTNGKTVVKVIAVPGKLVNIVVK